MATPDFYGMLSSLGDTFQQNRRTNERERTLAELGQGGGPIDYNEAARKLLAVDPQAAMSLAQLGNTQAQQEWTRTYQGGMLDIARTQANRKEEPENIRTLRAAGMDPSSPEGRKALFPRTDTPISATDKKAIFEAEDMVPQLQGTREALARAKEINDKTFTGYTAGIRGEIGTKLPGGGALVDKNAALATAEWAKIMGPEALQQMANTLKGATTDFELRKFIEMLGDQSADPKIRASVIDRMLKLTDRKLEIQGARVKDLRGGSYFKPGADPTGMTPASPEAKPQSSVTRDSVQAARANPQATIAEAKQAIAAGADREAVIKRLRNVGIDPAGL